MISNASDALDKIRFLSLTDKAALSATDELSVKIKVCVYIQGYIQDFLPGRGNTTAGGLEGYK